MARPSARLCFILIPLAPLAASATDHGSHATPGGAHPQAPAVSGPSVPNADAAAPATGASVDAAVPPAGATDVDAAAAAPAGPAAAADSRQQAAEAAQGAVDPGAPLLAPRAQAATRSLRSATGQLRRVEKLEASAQEASTEQALNSVFHGEAERRALTGVAPGEAAGVAAGAAQSVEQKIAKTGRVADTASPYDAPALYKQAIRVAEEAALAKQLSEQTAQRVADAVVRSARGHAQPKLTQLVNEAYRAAASGPAGRAVVDKAYKAYQAWNGFLGGGPDRPLVPNWGDVQGDVERVLAETALAGRARSGPAPRITFRREGDQLVADLATAGEQPHAASAGALPRGFLAGLKLDERAVTVRAARPAVVADPGGWLGRGRAIYAENARTGHDPLTSAVRAGWYLERSAARSAWQQLLEAIAAIEGALAPGRVDLGEGQVLVSSDRALARMAALRRTLEGDERALLGRLPGSVGAAFIDLARVNRRGAAAARAASRRVTTVGQLKDLFSAVDSEASEYGQLTGDQSALSAVASLRRYAAPALRLDDAAALPEAFASAGDPAAPGGAPFWASRLAQAELDHLDRQFLAVAKRRGLLAFAYADLRSGPGAGVRLVARAATPALAAELEGLGFETEKGAGGALRAWTSGPALAQRLEAALSRLSGATAPGSGAELVARAAAWAGSDEHESEARRLAELVSADAASTGFEAAGLVSVRGRPLLGETGLRSVDGKPSRVALLRDAGSRRAVYGFAEPLRSSPAR